MSQDVVEVLAVQAVVTRVAHYLDARRWKELAALFADEVETDYTALFGGDVQKESAEDLVLKGWQSLLSPLDATHHLLGPIEVEVKRKTAHAECHFQAYHLASRAKSGPDWTIAGHYVFTLHRSFGGVWKIEKLILSPSYQTGNRQLLSEAGGKPA